MYNDKTSLHRFMTHITLGRRSDRGEEMLTGCSLTCFIIDYKFTYIELAMFFFIEPD